MAILRSKMLFFTTSPRTPLKMIPEIKLLTDNFTGDKWNKKSQIHYAKLLSQNPYFQGNGSKGDMAFSARDRINRAPKALGFVNLKPTIQLTKAGKAFISGKRSGEALLRQLLKFQLPSPYHKEAVSKHGVFWVKPYLEILRLIYELKEITFDELMLFGMQLTDYRKFDGIVNRIKNFRKGKKKYQGSYKQYFGAVLDSELLKIFNEEILNGKTATRESTDTSIVKFEKTKRSNLRDYTDACFRYLRATNLVSISHRGHSVSIMPDKINDVKFILNTVKREPVFVNDEIKYKDYLFNDVSPVLYTDNIDHLTEYILKHSSKTYGQLVGKNVEELKDIRDNVIDENRKSIISKQVKKLKSYSLYSEVIDTYNEIISDQLYDIDLNPED